MPFHLYIAHAPAILIFLGAGADLIGAVTGRQALRRWATSLLILAGIAAALAFITGSGALPGAVARSSVHAERIATHSQWGGAGALPLVLAGLLRLHWRNVLHGATGWLALAAALASLLIVTGILLSGLAIAHA